MVTHPESCELFSDADAVILSTVLYQLPHDKQTKVLEVLKELLKPSAIVIIQDFAEISESQNHQLVFGEWFHNPYAYRTFVTSVNLKWEFIEVFRWASSRCLEASHGLHLNELAKLEGFFLSHWTRRI